MRTLARTYWLGLLVVILADSTPGQAGDLGLKAGLPRVTPEMVGMDAQRLAAIRARMQEFVASGQVAGIVTLVAKDGGVVELSAVGYRDLEAKAPMTEDTIFAIASMTKPITATALMMLVDQGKVALDDPIEKYIPEFREARLEDGSVPKRPITVFDCLTHTSGVVGDQRNIGSIAETARALAKRPLAFHPGERWAYSPGLTLVGRVVEVASGQPFEQYLHDRIFAPLGMVDTTFHPTQEQQKRLAKLYKPGAERGTLVATSHWINEITPSRTPNPSGGLFSTAPDLVRFYQMVLNGGEWNGTRILSREAVAKMTSLQTGDLPTGFTEGNGWALGWCVVRRPQGTTGPLSAGSFGHGGAFGTQGWIDPKRRMIYILLVQRTEFGNSDASDLRGELHRLAVEALRE